MTYWATQPKETHTIKNNNCSKCQPNLQPSRSQQYFLIGQTNFILTSIVSSDGAAMILREERPKRKGWTKGLDMKEKSSERNTTKKIKINLERTKHFSSTTMTIRNVKKKKRAKKVSKILRLKRVRTILALANPNNHNKKTPNTNSGAVKNKEKPDCKSSDKKPTKTCQCSWYSCWL